MNPEEQLSKFKSILFDPHYGMKKRRGFFLRGDWNCRSRMSSEGWLDLTPQIRRELSHFPITSKQVHNAIIEANVDTLMIEIGTSVEHVIKLFKLALKRKSIPFLQVEVPGYVFFRVDELIEFFEKENLQIRLVIGGLCLFNHDYLYRNTTAVNEVTGDNFTDIKWSRFHRLECLSVIVDDCYEFITKIKHCQKAQIMEIKVQFWSSYRTEKTSWLRHGFLEKAAHNAFQMIPALKRVSYYLKDHGYEARDPLSNNKRYQETILVHPIKPGKVVGVVYQSKVISLKEKCLALIEEKHIGTSSLPLN